MEGLPTGPRYLCSAIPPRLDEPVRAHGGVGAEATDSEKLCFTPGQGLNPPDACRHDIKLRSWWPGGGHSSSLSGRSPMPEILLALGRSSELLSERKLLPSLGSFGGFGGAGGVFVVGPVDSISPASSFTAGFGNKNQTHG